MAIRLVPTRAAKNPARSPLAIRRQRLDRKTRRRALFAHLEQLEDRSMMAINITENFETFLGTGFSPTPVAGQLDSDAWASTGLSDGTLLFGGTRTTGDYARGTSAVGVTTGGIYSFSTGAGNEILGVQSSDADFTPGTLTYRVFNDATVAVNPVVSFTGWLNNNEARDSLITVSYSLDDSTYTPIPSFTIATPAAADGNGWVSANFSTTLTGVTIGAGQEFEIRWSADDIGSSSNRDEFGIDNITITAGAANTAPTITPIANQSTRSFEPVTTPAFTLGDAESAAGALIVTTSSSNQAVVPDANITVVGGGASRTIVVRPGGDPAISNAVVGTSTITVTVTDPGGLTAVRTYVVTVNPAPTIYIPKTIAGNLGDVVTIPVFFNSNGTIAQPLEGIDLAILYDLNVLTINSVALGPALSAGAGWTVLGNFVIDPGKISIGLYTNMPVNTAVNGQVATITATIKVTAPAGPSPINLVKNSLLNGSVVINTWVNEDGILLGPNPTAASNDPISDGIVTVGGPLNSPPTLNAIPTPLNIHENSGLQVVNLAGITAGGESQALSVSVTSSVPGVIPTPTVSYLSPSATGSISFSPAAFGSSVITVTVRDAGFNGTLGDGDDGTFSQQFTVNVASVNSPPSFVIGPNQTPLEDAAPVSIPNWATSISAGPADESGQILTFNVTANTNPTLFSAGPSVAANGTLTYTLAANANGLATITLALQDNGGTTGGGIDTSGTQTFTIDVTPINDVPSFTVGLNQTIAFNSPAQTVNGWASSISTGPANESAQTVSFNITGNTLPGLFTVPPAVSSNGTLTYTPAAGMSGTSTITLAVQDSGGTVNGGVNTSATQTFTITINPAPVNSPPTLTAIGPYGPILEDAGLQTVPLTGITAGGESQALLITATSDTTSVIPHPTVIYTSPNGTGSLTFTPVPNASGTATITVTVFDAGLDGTLGNGDDGSIVRTFLVTVTAVNDEPSFGGLATQTVLEDAGAQTVNGFATSILAGPADEAAQTLTFNITANTNPGLFSVQPAISSTGVLTYTPAGNANGTATVSVALSDNGGIANGGDNTSPTLTFVINVTAVNDAPTFVLPATHTSNEDGGAQSVSGFVTSILAGPTDEAGQTLTFNITGNTNPGLFAVAPSISSAGVLTYTANPNLFGSSTISVTLSDNGGILNSGANTSITQTFVINVNPVNDVPSFTAGPNQVVFEDAGPQSVTAWATAISPGPSNESGQTITFQIVTNTNSGLFSTQPTISSAGLLTYVPAGNANGVATITVQAVDSGGTAFSGVDTSPTQTFTITVTAVNDAPSFTVGANQTVNEDAGAQTVGVWATAVSAGPSDESGQTLSFAMTGNTNPGLFAVAPAVSASGVLTYTPALNANGIATITLNIADNGGTAGGGANASASQSFTITVTPVNDIPSFVIGGNQTINFNSPPQTVVGFATLISAGPANEVSQTVNFNLTGNTLPALFTTPPAIASNGTLTYTPAAGQTGTSTITFVAQDTGGIVNGGVDTTASQTFTITISPAPVNSPPTLDIISPLNINEDAGLQTVNLTNITAGGETQNLQVTVSSTNTAVVPTPTVIYTSPNNFGSLTFTPPANINGTSTVTVTVTDAGLDGDLGTTGDNGTIVRSFLVTVAAVNDAPTFVVGPNQGILEDAGAQSVSGWATSISAGPSDESGQTLTFNITGNTNPGLFAAGPTISPAGLLTYTPAANANGLSTISVTLSDNGGGTNTSGTATFTINVTAVNDAPSFTIGANQTIAFNSPAQTVNPWATAVSSGPANESGQTVFFSVTNNTNPGLFSVAPAISPAGVLTYTPTTGVSGTATITIDLTDNGGNLNGGVPTSAPQVFIITVSAAPVNNLPTLDVINPLTINEDATLQTVNLAGITAGGEVQALSVTASSNNTGLIPNPTVNYTTPNAIGSLTFTPVANANGTATITVTVTDAGLDGNLGTTGDNGTFVRTFLVTVTAVNDTPSFVVGANQTVLEDAAAQTVNPWATAISAGPTDEAGQTLTFAVTANTNPSLFSAGPSISSAGVLTYTPAAQANGTATISVTLSDNGGGANTSTVQTFTIDVTPVNDAPSFTVGANQTVNEDAGLQTVSGWVSVLSAGPANESGQVLSFAVTGNTNPSLFSSAPAVSSTGVLTYTPTANVSGTATITLNIADNGGTTNGGVNASVSQTFTITVNAVNDAPSFTVGANQTVNEDAGAQTVGVWATAVSAGPTDESGQTLTFSVTGNTNPSLFLVAPTVSSTGALSYTPAANANGSATITLNIADNGGTVNGGVNASGSQSFTINITPVNDVPSFTVGANQTVAFNSPAQTVSGFATALSAGPTDEAGQTLSFNVVSNSNPGLFSSVPAIAPNGTLTYTPAVGATGTSIIAVNIMDSGGTLNGGVNTSAAQTFTITITAAPINNPPTITPISTLTINEDAGVQTVNMSGITAGGESQALTVTAASNNVGLIPNPTVSYTSPAATGSLTFTPVANQNGAATITVTVRDVGLDGIPANGDDGITTTSFVVDVTPVNDVPSFTAGLNQTVAFNAPAQTVPGWASGLSAGPTNESAQTLSFNITANTNPALFSAGPAVASNGTLTYTPATGVSGTATITLNVMDNGGIANGGVDTSATQTFTITVNAAPVNNPPTINPISNITLPEDAGIQTVALAGITAGGEAQALSVTVTSVNTALIPTPTINYTSPNSTGSLLFTPSANQSGSSLITVTVRDAGLNGLLGDGDDGQITTTFTVTITPVNDPPDATDSTASTTVNTAVSGVVSVTDPDGPSLTFAVTLPPALGTLTSFNTTTGAFTYTPGAGNTGLDLFTFTVTDGTTTDSATVRITIQSAGPVVIPNAGNLTVIGTGTDDTVLISAAGTGQVRVRTAGGGTATSAYYPLTGTITVSTGDGRDTINISGVTNPTSIDAGAGDDRVSTGIGNDLIVGGSGNDQINASGGDNVVWGDEIGQQELAAGGDDVLSSLTGNDVMYGGGGQDQLYSGGGNDYAHAGQGHDFVSAGDGNDRIFGGAGNDILGGDFGDDVISGGSGNDQLLGGDGNDILIGGTGGSGDSIDGGAGNDLIVASDTINSASSTVGDANDVALMALLTNWNATHAANIASGIVTGDDGAVDTLVGSVGDDDFYANFTDSLTDFNTVGNGTDRRFP